MNRSGDVLVPTSISHAHRSDYEPFPPWFKGTMLRESFRKILTSSQRRLVADSAATGVHRPNKSNEWSFSAPYEDHPTNLKPVWDFLDEEVFQTQPATQNLGKLFQKLSSPPFGVMEGLNPVVFCAFMLANKDEVTLYRESTFLPEPSVADFEIILRRPELYSIAGCRVKGDRAAVVSRLAKAFSVKSTTVLVVRALFKMFRSLPQYALRTARVPEVVKKIRDSFDHATSPERFLFVELPQAMGLDPFRDEKVESATIENFFKILNQNLEVLRSLTPQMTDKARDILLEACGFSVGSESWRELRLAGLSLEPFATHPDLQNFLKRLNQTANDHSGVVPVLELVALAPLETWTDYDVDNFTTLAKTIGILFREASGMHSRQESRLLLESLSAEQRKQANAIKERIEHLLNSQFKASDIKAIQAALNSMFLQLQQRKHKND